MAVVYRNKRNYLLGSDEPLARVDPDTSEVFFDDPRTESKYRTQRRVAEYHLGNVSEIAELRAEVISLLGANCLLARKILYSGTHAGDEIRNPDIGFLSQEIKVIRDSGRESQYLSRFLSSLEDLIQRAGEQENPIVFV